jgi:hypothetical protein
MARLSNVSIEAPDTTAINLTVLLARLNEHLFTPDAQTEHNLRASQRERDRVGKVRGANHSAREEVTNDLFVEPRICTGASCETRTRCAGHQSTITETADTARSRQ